MGVCCLRSVRRAMVSEIVRMTSGCSWIAGEVSEGEVLASSGLELASAMVVGAFTARESSLFRDRRVENYLVKSTTFGWWSAASPIEDDALEART